MEQACNNPEHKAKLDSKIEQLLALAPELDFIETPDLKALHAATANLIANDPEAGREAMTTYQIAAASWVESHPQLSNASIGYRLTVAIIRLEAGQIDDGLDELWDVAYQAGQTPGIETLREALEAFVTTFDDTP